MSRINILLLILASTASAFFWTPALHGGGAQHNQNQPIRVKDPTAILKFHLAALENIVATKNTQMLLKMVPAGDYRESDIEEFYKFHKDIRFNVSKAEFVSEKEIQGTAQLSRPAGYRNHKGIEMRKESQAIVTITSDAESPTKWKLLRVETLGQPQPERRDWSYLCLLGWIACLIYG